MNKYILDEIEPKDIDKVVAIYNSNKNFLKSHMGISSISKKFVVNEIKEIKNIGFSSFIIKNNREQIVGVCDFKIADEVYLSLLMIDSKLKGKGLGKVIYTQLEEMFKSKKVNSIRIDVVYDYQKNVLGFWKKQGFISCKKIELEWNGYKSNAIKMYKDIC